MHPDFAHLQVRPGVMSLEPGAPQGAFALTNILEFGGAAGKGAHMPAIVGQVENVVLWESTGALRTHSRSGTPTTPATSICC